MGKYCPIVKRKVTYLDCMECDERKCEEISRGEERKERKEKRREKHSALYQKKEDAE